MRRGLSGAEWEIIFDVWQHTSGHYDRSKGAVRTEYTATAEQIAERCSHSVDHIRKAIRRLVGQNIIRRPVVGRHGGYSVLAFNWDISTWSPRDEVSAAKTHSRSGTTAYEDDISRSGTTAYGDTAGQKRPPEDAVAGQKRPASFKGNLRAEPKAPPPVNCSNVESALPESADRETAAPCGLEGRVAAGRASGPPVDGDGTAPRRRPPEDLADAERHLLSIVEKGVQRGVLPARMLTHATPRDRDGQMVLLIDEETERQMCSPEWYQFFEECGWDVGIRIRLNADGEIAGYVLTFQSCRRRQAPSSNGHPCP
jgi:hypothetical protein